MPLTCDLELCEKFDICDQCSQSMYSNEDTEDDSYYSDYDTDKDKDADTPGYPQGYPLRDFAVLSVLSVLGGVLAGGLFYRSIVKK